MPISLTLKDSLKQNFGHVLALGFLPLGQGCGSLLNHNIGRSCPARTDRAVWQRHVGRVGVEDGRVVLGGEDVPGVHHAEAGLAHGAVPHHHDLEVLLGAVHGVLGGQHGNWRLRHGAGTWWLSLTRCTSVTVWLFDSVTVWLCDCVTVWQCDCVTVWLSDR